MGDNYWISSLSVVACLNLVPRWGWSAYDPSMAHLYGSESRGTDRRGSVLGWPDGIRLMALAFAMMIFVAFAIVIPAQIFLYKHLSTAP